MNQPHLVLLVVLALAAVTGAGVALACLRRMRTMEQELRTSRRAAKKDPYLGVPATVHAPSKDSPQYAPDITGTKLEFLGRTLSPQAEAWLLRPMRSGPEDPQALGLLPPMLQPGDRLTVLDNVLHDYGVGTSFVRVRREDDGAEGLLDYQTFFAETANRSATDDPKLVIPLPHDGGAGLLHLFSPMGPKDRDACLARLEARDYDRTFASAKGGGCNPTFASVQAARALACALDPATDDDLRQRITAAGEKFFAEYGFPAAQEVAGGTAWACNYAFQLNWKITLSPPWYGGYPAAVMAQNAAMLHRLTGREDYRELVLSTMRYLRAPMSGGGAGYDVNGFPHIAEYAYPSPPLPNIRVLDGELISALCVAGCAALLRDTDLTRYAAALCAGLAAGLDSFTTVDGLILNARYPWLVEDEGYTQVMVNCAAQLHRLTKDRAFDRAAKTWRVSDEHWR